MSEGTAERIARWFAEPTRSLLWGTLTGNYAKTGPSSGLVLIALRPLVWFALAVGGIASLLVAILAADESWWVMLLAGVGISAFLIGVVLGFLLKRIGTVRHTERVDQHQTEDAVVA